MQSWHKDIIDDKLLQILECISLINQWSEKYSTADEFLLSPTGTAILDACILRLQIIGENVRSIDEMTNKNLFVKYPEIPWKQIIGLRNIISHQYSNINYDMIVDIVKNHLLVLNATIERIKKEL